MKPSDEFLSAFQKFRDGDPEPLRHYLASSTCIACEGPGPLTAGYCKACHDDLCAHYDRHAEGCRCPECDPVWNDPETIRREEWERDHVRSEP